MKHILAVPAVLLLLQGCTESGHSPPVTTGRPARAIPLVPTELAESLGITAENYPFIDGSTSTLPLVRGIYASMFRPSGYRDPEYIHLGSLPMENFQDMAYPGMPREASKTVESYEMLIAGEVDLIFVPDPSDDVNQQAADAGVELEYIPIGVEALVFITSVRNSADSVTVEQLADIYSDMSITNWADLGGKDGPIVAYCRNKDSGSHAQMENLVLRGKPVHPDILKKRMHVTMESTLHQIYYQERDADTEGRYSLGYTLFYYLRRMNDVAFKTDRDRADTRPFEERRGIKMLAVDGVVPTEETIASKEYKLSMGYFAVIRKDQPADSPTRKMVEWLISDDGQLVVAGAGLGALRPVTGRPPWWHSE